MEADTYSALTKTIQRDCRVLESFKIMDYSLLLGIHNLDQAQREKMVSDYSKPIVAKYSFFSLAGKTISISFRRGPGRR